MKITVSIALILSFLVAIHASATAAPTPTPAPFSYPTTLPSYEAVIHRLQSHHVPSTEERPWVDENDPWTADDRPYLRVRQSIDLLYQAKRMSDAQLLRYAQDLERHSNDPIARFQWAYYAFCLARLHPNASFGSMKLWAVPIEFIAYPSPHSYQYTRLRFLVLAFGNDILNHEETESNRNNLKQLGDRLLRHNPQDTLVKYYQISSLLIGGDAGLNRALQYAREIVQEKPNEPLSHWILGWVFNYRWETHHRPEDAQGAVNSYRKYLSMARPGELQRQRVEEYLPALQAALR